MKIEITVNEAMDLLLKDEYSNWTVGEARALAEWYEAYEESAGEDFLFCPVSIRCDWSSYADIEEVSEAYGLEAGELTLQELQEKSSHVIEVKELRFGDKVFYPASILVMDF